MKGSRTPRRRTRVLKLVLLSVLCVLILAGTVRYVLNEISEEPENSVESSVAKEGKKQEQYLAPQAASPEIVDSRFGKVCFLVRTFRGHGPAANDQFNLRATFIPSLLALKYKNWVALFVDTDRDGAGGPFADLSSILALYEDKRLVALDMNQVAPGMTVKFDRLRDCGYTMTDRGIRFCPNDTKWLVVTNGDNGYLPDFLSEETLSRTEDIVGVDFFSRHRCDCKHARFCCMPNRVTQTWTDLGANIMNHQRFVSENRLFSEEQQDTGQDGHMLDRLRKNGWTVGRVERCLFAHSPSTAGCQWYTSGYWVNHENKCRSEEYGKQGLASGQLQLFTHPDGFRCLHKPGEELRHWGYR
mmetsp:Transcript_288/g.556  ORF Transcript_288/g.556 Transcript_288/m.556 type:complete len:357 (-) Transcript_288:74-1144(-)